MLTRHVNTRKRPSFIKPLTDIEVVEGESVTFECHVDGIPEPIIIWTANKKEIKESKYFQMSYNGKTIKRSPIHDILLRSIPWWSRDEDASREVTRCHEGGLYEDS